MSWGNRLVAVFVAFAALMGTLVYLCMKQNIELVSKDYYADELRYQDKIDGMNNANKITDVVITGSDNQVIITMPKEQQGLVLTGEAWFYCATNASSDRKLPLQVNEQGQFVIEKSRLARANYTLKLSWQAGDDHFHTEKFIEVN
ncbi:FixH family protein [Aridibaculum aurantiacum]|uniref:FixH family protein n=1 Tax=Aridibaculum aurantiacum TaxID=2810307 RepID=UPI001A976389|nr:FixH family protein [Aridibaculum aurantiacum]